MMKQDGQQQCVSGSPKVGNRTRTYSFRLQNPERDLATLIERAGRALAEVQAGHQGCWALMVWQNWNVSIAGEH
jgi:hypothetical protein